MALGGLLPARQDSDGCFDRKGPGAGGYRLPSFRGAEGFAALASRPTAGSP